MSTYFLLYTISKNFPKILFFKNELYVIWQIILKENRILYDIEQYCCSNKMLTGELHMLWPHS